jgi:hypothetical protein
MCPPAAPPPARMIGIEVAYLALADWLALVAESEQR